MVTHAITSPRSCVAHYSHTLLGQRLELSKGRVDLAPARLAIFPRKPCVVARGDLRRVNDILHRLRQWVMRPPLVPFCIICGAIVMIREQHVAAVARLCV